MKLWLAIILMLSCLASGLALGISFTSMEYSPMLERQAAIINIQGENIKAQNLLLDAWKKAANMMSSELRICEEEKE